MIVALPSVVLTPRKGAGGRWGLKEGEGERGEGWGGLPDLSSKIRTWDKRWGASIPTIRSNTLLTSLIILCTCSCMPYPVVTSTHSFRETPASKRAQNHCKTQKVHPSKRSVFHYRASLHAHRHGTTIKTKPSGRRELLETRHKCSGFWA